MLTAIRVGNFKAFADLQRIPVRPLTLIYGANSSGKSSILHALILARHAMETGDLDVHCTNIGGEAVDLGGFRQFIHRCDVSRRMEWSAELNTACFTGRPAELLAPVKRLTISLSIGIALDDEGQPLLEAIPEIHLYEISERDKRIIRLSKRKSGMQIDAIDLEHPIFRNAVEKRFGHITRRRRKRISYGIIGRAVNEILPNLFITQGKLLPENVIFQIEPGQKISDFTPAGYQDFIVARGSPEFKAFQKIIRSGLPNSISKEDCNDYEFAVRGFLEILKEVLISISRALSGELRKLQYLGPLRSYPPRHLAFSQLHDPNWFAGGGYAWDVVRRDPDVRSQVNAWLTAPDRLQTPYELRIRHLLTIDDLDAEYTKT